MFFYVLRLLNRMLHYKTYVTRRTHLCKLNVKEQSTLNCFFKNMKSLEKYTNPACRRVCFKEISKDKVYGFKMVIYLRSTSVYTVRSKIVTRKRTPNLYKLKKGLPYGRGLILSFILCSKWIIFHLNLFLLTAEHCKAGRIRDNGLGSVPPSLCPSVRLSARAGRSPAFQGPGTPLNGLMGTRESHRAGPQL